MSDKTNERIEYTEQLLLELQGLLKDLSEITSGIEKNSDLFYRDFFESNIPSIQSDLDNYESNNEKIKKLKLKITMEVNNWFAFTKDPDEVKKISFPINLYIRKKRLYKTIKNISDEISSTNIENRFIKEKLLSWKQDLAMECIKTIKTRNEFGDYETLLKRKKSVINELKYLLSTIQGICPLELDLRNLDSFIVKFRIKGRVI